MLFFKPIVKADKSGAFFTKQLLVTIFLKALFNTIAFAINTCHSIGDILKHEGKNQSITTLKIH